MPRNDPAFTSRERELLERVRGLLLAVGGRGGRLGGLAADEGAVQFGGRFSPDMLPSAFVFPVGHSSRQDPGRTLLTQYDRTFVVQIELWLAAEDGEDPLLAACDACAEVRLALERDPTLGGYADNIVVDDDYWSGRELDAPDGTALAVLQARYDYREDRAK